MSGPPNNDAELPAGVPLGGVGAGSIEMGRDGRFRNITINNNRTGDTRIPVSEGSFLAVRASQRGRVETRILQPDSGVPFREAGIVAPFVPTEQLNWRGVYPTASYQLDDKRFPLSVAWTAMSPIVPYDTDASTLPLMFLTFYVRNTTEQLLDVSTVFNWENICGCTRDAWPEKRGPIRPVRFRDLRGEQSLIDEKEARDGETRLSGLEFGFRETPRNNAEGTYSLLAKQVQGVDISVLGWNERDAGELDAFWQQFYYDGKLSSAVSRNDMSHSAAVCCSATLEAGQAISLVYVLTWHCPRFVLDDVEIGNGYANKWRNAVAVAGQALTHYRYFFKSVEDWHNRILQSSLPRWLSRMLINNNYVLSTNTLYTRENVFVMMESPESPWTTVMDQRLLGSLGPLLFFPNFEESELQLASRLSHPSARNRIFRTLGKGCVHQPEIGDGIDATLTFILTAYRNYVMTGKRYVLDHLFERVKGAMAYVLEQDRDGDGLPEATGAIPGCTDGQVYGVNSQTASLWIAALRVYPALARRYGDTIESDKYAALYDRAVKRFNELLWDEEAECYRFYHDPAGEAEDHSARDRRCFASQLAGQWFAEFLCLGNLFDEERIRKALGVICRRNEQRYGLGTLATVDDDSQLPLESRPNWDVPIVSSMLMRHGFADRGLFILQKAHRNVHGRRGRTFCQPLTWDLAANNAKGNDHDRHMGSPSIWQIYYALTGFHLNMPDSCLWLRPKLPQGVFRLDAPLFTPLSFGRLQYRLDDAKGFRLETRLMFDSPISVRLFVLAVPQEVTDVYVRLETEDGVEECSHTFGMDGSEKLIQITAKEPVLLTQPLTITLQQIKGAQFRFPARPQDQMG